MIVGVDVSGTIMHTIAADYLGVSQWVSNCWLMSREQFCQLYHGANKLHVDELMVIYPTGGEYTNHYTAETSINPGTSKYY